MKPIVIKIGGSTLGNHDTTLEDLVTIQNRGIPMIVVHGGAKQINEWLKKLNINANFVRGLRVTDIHTLKVVTAVLAGIVNKELVSDIAKLGGKAIGITGADGKLIQAKNKTPELGYTGEELSVNPELLLVLLEKGYLPVIAPVCFGIYNELQIETNLINVNGDTAAAEIASITNADKLIFLTDVPGLYDNNHNIISELNVSKAKELMKNGIISGGMTAKINACIDAVAKVSITRIIDGRIKHALIDEIDGKNRGEGTTIVR